MDRGQWTVGRGQAMVGIIELLLGILLFILGLLTLLPGTMNWLYAKVLTIDWVVLPGWRRREEAYERWKPVMRIGMPAMLLLVGAAMIIGGIQEIV